MKTFSRANENPLVTKSKSIGYSACEAAVSCLDPSSYELELAVVEGTLESLGDLPAPIDCQKLAGEFMHNRYSNERKNK